MAGAVFGLTRKVTVELPNLVGSNRGLVSAGLVCDERTTRHSPKNLPNPAQSDTGTTESEAKGVDTVHTLFL
jgi:hypothetical protein